MSRTRAEAMATLWQARTRLLLEGERQRADGAAPWTHAAARALIRVADDGAVLFVVYDPAGPRCPAFVLWQCRDRTAAAGQARVWQQALAAQIAAVIGASEPAVGCSVGSALHPAFYR